MAGRPMALKLAQPPRLQLIEGARFEAISAIQEALGEKAAEAWDNVGMPSLKWKLAVSYSK